MWYILWIKMWSHWKAHVLTFLTTCIHERRYCAVNMVRIKIKFDNCAGSWLSFGFHSLPLYRVKTTNDDRDPAQWYDLAFKFLLYTIYGAVSRLSYKQLSHSRFQRQSKPKQNLWNTGEWIAMTLHFDSQNLPHFQKWTKEQNWQTFLLRSSRKYLAMNKKKRPCLYAFTVSPGSGAFIVPDINLSLCP